MTSKISSAFRSVFRGPRGRSLHRRTILRGACSTVLALPLLECMLDDNGEALAQGVTLPKRYLHFYAPMSLLGSGEPWEGERFTPPSGPTFGQNLPYCLQPLADRGVADQVSAVTGLFVSPYNDRPGSYADDYHGMGFMAALTGVTVTENWPAVGVTADQIIAEAIGDQTPYSYLFYAVDPEPGVEPAVIRRKSDGSSDWVDSQRSPAQGYRNLFMGFTPPGDGEPVDDLEERLRRSSLSYVGDQIESLQKRLSAADRIRLDAHLTQVRELEMRIAAGVPGSAGQACQDPMLPDPDPGPLDVDARAELMTDLIAMAVACDMSRAITLAGSEQMTGDGMLSTLWPGGLHGDVQHIGPQKDMDDANRWFVEKYAGLLAKLQAIPEGAGTALDNCAAVYMMEGGKAGRAADGGQDENHSTDNMVMLLGGKAGGLVPGKHVVAQDEHTGVVFNTAMQAIGVDEQLGEISGTVPELFST